MTHGREKSDPAIVAMKPANRAGRPAAEQGEPRAGAEGNASQQSTRRTQSRESVSQALERIRRVAKGRKKEKFTALFHHLSLALFEEAFFDLKKKAAVGVDGLAWRDYEADLEPRLADLHARVQRGAYLALVLNAIYEEDFIGFSYGFRPGRGAHDAMDALVVGVTRSKVGFILDADIERFFDTVSHDWLIRFLEHRIGDKRIVRLIQRWLKAGVLEDGVVRVGDKGTGQGSVISPLLANIYLHYVLDLWAVRWRRREATGDMVLVRYADDIVVGFQFKKDARRFLDAMRERFEVYALSLHPDKTRLIEFGRHAAAKRERRGLGKPETFPFLGFTFICGTSRRGAFRIDRRSRADRLRTKLKEIKEELRRRMHQLIPEQGRWLGQVVQGYFNYFAVPTNSRALSAFHHHVLALWRRTLQRRSQTDRTTWARVEQLGRDYLPKPCILHPWPDSRFAVRHPRWEPYASKSHVRLCAGGA